MTKPIVTELDQDMRSGVPTATSYVIPFDRIGIRDVPLVGGKNASLGELTRIGIPVPPGFALSVVFYREFLNETGLIAHIREQLTGLDTGDVERLQKVGKNIRSKILSSEFPPHLREQIAEGYLELSRGAALPVAVRSSATAEDLADASFAGAQDTYLNVVGEKKVMECAKKCIASLFTDRAISYRAKKGFDHLDVGLSVGIQKMVNSEAAGVMFTIDPDSGNENVIVIDSNWGLGESVVSGKVIPDKFYIFKRTGEIVGSRIGQKEVYAKYDSAGTVFVNTPLKRRAKFSLAKEHVKVLVEYARKIEEHYQKRMDIEWAVEGNAIYILQARPETVQSSKGTLEEIFHLKGEGKLLVAGIAVGGKIGQGKPNVMADVSEMKNFVSGEILVTRETTPAWEPVMEKAAAIVTEQGGTTSHAAIVSRELGKTCVVGARRVTQLLHNHSNHITVDCSTGVGNIYDGLIPFEIERFDLSTIPETRTKIMMNMAVPEGAFAHAKKADGVGLLRIEFVYGNSVGIHPAALLNYEQLKRDPQNFLRAPPKTKDVQYLKRTITEIEAQTQGYDNKPQFLVEKLREGIAMVAAAMDPKPVIVRFSDFKSNEYAALVGGEIFEKGENNPMLGWRGASRYPHTEFAEAFRLECRALREARELGLHNIIPMIPFVRTVEEAKAVLELMKAEGLERGKGGLQVYMMAEIPSNVFLAEEFSKLFDGFSIGSNDLASLVLGVDRDNAKLAKSTFDERNPAVRMAIEHLIKTAHKNGIKIGICGQAPSDYPEIVEFLVENGIDSISLNADVIGRMKRVVATVEERHANAMKKQT
ncbi:MAG: phosphoenolpyruvate synthase [Candidatus Bathyarchaeia archaeon]